MAVSLPASERYAVSPGAVIDMDGDTDHGIVGADELCSLVEGCDGFVRSRVDAEDCCWQGLEVLDNFCICRIKKYILLVSSNVPAASRSTTSFQGILIRNRATP